jgi:hypothetical protein
MTNLEMFFEGHVEVADLSATLISDPAWLFSEVI